MCRTSKLQQLYANRHSKHYIFAIQDADKSVENKRRGKENFKRKILFISFLKHPEKHKNAACCEKLALP